MGPILFNLFLNDLLTVLKKSGSKWFRENNMIVNPDKFQAMVWQKQDKNS